MPFNPLRHSICSSFHDDHEAEQHCQFNCNSVFGLLSLKLQNVWIFCIPRLNMVLPNVIWFFNIFSSTSIWMSIKRLQFTNSLEFEIWTRSLFTIKDVYSNNIDSMLINYYLCVTFLLKYQISLFLFHFNWLFI